MATLTEKMPFVATDAALDRAISERIDRLSLVYEQGLSLANNALRLEYELTRSLRLRAEAGAISGIGVVFRRSFD